MKFGIIGNLSKPELWKATGDLIRRLRKLNVGFVVLNELATMLRMHDPQCPITQGTIVPGEKLPDECDIVVAFGGDGTILQAARLVGNRGTPIIGVNLGKLGFLTEFAVGDIPVLIDHILEKNYQIEDRMILSGNVSGDSHTAFNALNDVVIDKGAYSRLINIETYVNGEYLATYSCDGLIISTPTGSTGYSLSALGPIIVPSAQVIIVNPITPHTLTARPIILPESSVIKAVIRSEGERIHVAADGQVNANYPSPVELTIRKADYTVRLVKRKDRSYFDVLRTKLMWGQDVRTVK